MKKLYFIRHGLSELNVSGHFAGHTETPLVTEGRAQAKKAGQAAKNLKIDLIVSSPLSRAYETAQIVAQEIGYPSKNILTNPILIERFCGVMEGQPYTPDLDCDSISGYETDAVLVERAREALGWINSLPTTHLLVVSHGGFGRALRSLLKTDFPMSHPEQINNAELACWLES